MVEDRFVETVDKAADHMRDKCCEDYLGAVAISGSPRDVETLRQRYPGVDQKYSVHVRCDAPPGKLYFGLPELTL